MKIMLGYLKQIFQWLQLLNNKVDELDKRIANIELLLTQEDNK
jgi:hypothetical protein